MNATLLFDSVLTVLFSLALVGAGGLTLWLLPWSDADRDGTVRAFGTVARHLGEVAGRPRSPFRVAPVAPAR
ncbi:MAG: hypothetical protein Q8P41_31080 [Pseudomonadota bacterium]|nr:hypothetical protein [Pseudomonadota bacterium]